MKNQSTKKLGTILAIIIILVMVGYAINRLRSTNSDIRVANVQLNQAISSPSLIIGEAKGTWYFEADFPVYLLDDEGNEIAVAIAIAQDDWMTEDFVPFKAKLDFEVEESGWGTLLFKKDNPSDISEYDDELRIPVLIEAE